MDDALSSQPWTIHREQHSSAIANIPSTWRPPATRLAYMSQALCTLAAKVYKAA